MKFRFITTALMLCMSFAATAANASASSKPTCCPHYAHMGMKGSHSPKAVPMGMRHGKATQSAKAMCNAMCKNMNPHESMEGMAGMAGMSSSTKKDQVCNETCCDHDCCDDSVCTTAECEKHCKES